MNEEQAHKAILRIEQLIRFVAEKADDTGINPEHRTSSEILKALNEASYASRKQRQEEKKEGKE